ncbi:Phage protein gp14 [Caldalkalibacillus thermarum TA2.A1]|nr:phage tail assembly chaperone [Caldalkalibacillus thermarum]EGL83736.1 Phage protein gp14 [Caldalkalibacillus thermarum TA2.A1]
MARIKIDLEQPYDEFEIGGKVYKVYYDDDSLRKYEKQCHKFADEAEAKPEKEISQMSEEEKKKLEEKQRGLLKETIETFFGENTYEEIYEAAGRSLVNMTKVVMALSEWLDSKMNVAQQKRREHYTKRNKKKR